MNVTAVFAFVVLLVADQRALNLYERIDQKLRANPALAAIVSTPAAEMSELQWMIGRWKVESRVLTPKPQEKADRGESVVEPAIGGTWLQIRDTYKDRVEDLGFMTFNSVTRRWTSVSLDKTGNSVTVSTDKWDGNRLVFTPDAVEIFGERVALRQTLEKRSANEYRILNEERMPNGEWVALDEYVYTRLR